VGDVRDRAQQVLDRLNVQTEAAQMEIVVADVGCGSHPRLKAATDGVPTVYIERSPDEPWGEVKAAAVRAAKGTVVAFIEDHSLPLVNWAEAVIRSSRENWVAAGYTFVNANPGTYLSRAGFITDYGEWAYPMPECRVRQLPCNNVAYRREELVRLGDKLGAMMHSDIALHEHFARQGKRLTIIRDATVAHQNHEQAGVLLRGNFAHCRVIGASRVQQGNWKWPRRLGYAIAVPILVPLMKLGRLMRAPLRRPVLWGATLASLPIATAVFVWSAIGESLGYLCGFGNSLQQFKEAEVSVLRSVELSDEIL
jgi:hypothetical protein